jgi:hypothetical protein
MARQGHRLPVSADFRLQGWWSEDENENDQADRRAAPIGLNTENL